jgi:predicted Na+-dependent transporter
MAWLAKRPLNQVKTISIETGIQNVGVAFLIVLTNFPVNIHLKFF